MTRDLLSEATRALRETHENPTDGARFTRSRVMASLQESKVRRRTRLAFLIPIAACFVTLSAWGAASGKLPKAIRAVAVAIGFEQPEPPKEPERAPVRRAAPPAPPSAAPAVEESPAPEPVQPEPEPAKPATPSSADPAPAASVIDPTHDLYRVAHRAHFVDQNPAAALAAWDEYLKAAPNGRFAVEARYNRALCLARLGRNAEAREALAPFAAGKYDGYRQREAAELSAAIGGAGTESKATAAP